MASSHEPTTIAGHQVEYVQVGNHRVGHIVINKDVSVIFHLPKGGGTGSGPGGGSKCLTCRISKIDQCAKRVCPPIKAGDPNASCSDAISKCIADECSSECSGGTGSGGGTASGGTGILIIA